jgi:hypothetical protein
VADIVVEMEGGEEEEDEVRDSYGVTGLALQTGEVCCNALANFELIIGSSCIQ